MKAATSSGVPMAVPVAPAAMCTIEVTFEPTALGTRTATLTVDSDDPATPRLSIGLSGTGVLVYPATGVTLTPSVASPQNVGTAVEFTAAGQGGTASAYQYKFWLHDGTKWTVEQDFSPDATWVLAGTRPAARYTVVVQVRTSSSVAYDAETRMVYVIQTTP